MPGSVWNSRWRAWPGLCSVMSRSSNARASTCAIVSIIGERLEAEAGAGGIVQDVGGDLDGVAHTERFDLEGRADGGERRRQVDEADVLADRVAPASAPEPTHHAT